MFEKIEGFVQSPRPKINGKEMPLLVPQYKKTKNRQSARAEFSMSEETLSRLKKWIEKTSDSVFVVRDGLTMPKISTFRDVIEQPGGIRLEPEKDYAALSFLQHRLVSHLSFAEKVSAGVRKLDEESDIVHFSTIRAHSEHVRELRDKINHVKQGEASNREIGNLGRRLEVGRNNTGRV